MKNTVIVGDFVYSHVNTMYVCYLSTKFLVTINYFLETIGHPQSLSKKDFFPQVQTTFKKHAIQQPNILKTKKPEVFHKCIY